jgi:hypothetical protein
MRFLMLLILFPFYFFIEVGLVEAVPVEGKLILVYFLAVTTPMPHTHSSFVFVTYSL